MSDWDLYEPGDPSAYVPVEKWGKDHWSTLAYVETRAVDHGGKLKNENLRTHARLHRELCGVVFGEVMDGAAYPTRLKGGETLDRHDDWSCLEDMAAAGLLVAYFRQARYDRAFGCNESRVDLLPKGLAVCAELRAHKAGGGNFADFTPSANALAVQNAEAA